MAAIYTSTTDVQARVPARTFGATSKPTTAEVTQWLEEGEAHLLVAISARGLSAPANNTTSMGKILQAAAVDYAESHVRNAWASTAGDENKDGQAAYDRFLAVVAKITDGAYDNALSSPAGASRAHGANTDTDADDYIAPEFERGEVF